MVTMQRPTLPRPTLSTPAVTLRPYQHEALAAIRAAGAGRYLTVIATGGGKTCIFSQYIDEQQRADPSKRAIVLVHRDELVSQTRDKLFAVNPWLQAGIVKAERDQAGHPVVVASIQTLAREQRLTRLLQSGPPFGTIVCDEAHHAAADTWQRVLTGLGSFRATDTPQTLGFTATPERADHRSLGDTWERIIYQKPMLDLIPEYLVDVRCIRVDVDMDLDRVRQSHGDFQDQALSEALTAAEAPELAARAYREHAALPRGSYSPRPSPAHD